MRGLLVAMGMVLLAPATAAAGGWATVGLDPLPDGVARVGLRGTPGDQFEKPEEGLR